MCYMPMHRSILYKMHFQNYYKSVLGYFFITTFLNIQVDIELYVDHINKENQLILH